MLVHVYRIFGESGLKNCPGGTGGAPRGHPYYGEAGQRSHTGLDLKRNRLLLLIAEETSAVCWAYLSRLLKCVSGVRSIEGCYPTTG